ncbi:RNA polymerase sigma factor SigW [Sporolactobacillus laevolacticus]|jgi:RNA polymerase sigma-70 factor (ECF subfamily)|uniref:RNA polymerase sigma factor SigW n=1 Tax=Sporolactobacillus laevolacticus DSM 442 TaxID=1395513 RepID=V6IV27_9BACL|nr:RNA polymerase sigma factor SigW [Sporolactobacillus laevolacticus]EST10301.1 RNA polymerase sigma factor SigW [Sporolactobacillus laevolacticus DSM 442]MDF2911756.1 polymerase sigma factor SigW [Sporolactobacillus laevolacticus]MDN3954429.1 RNA polymerase sigma factor SigW [Sporolactobacillus laevolacticus]
MDQKEKRLIKKVKKGDQQAFAELVDRYKNSVFAICFRMVGNTQEAEDLSQEAFIRAYNHIDQYDHERKFSTWLFRIATNLSIDFLRRRKTSVSLDAVVPGTEGLSLNTILPDNGELPDEQMVRRENEEMVQSEIKKLPEKYRSAVVLKYIEDLSLKEISDIMDIPVGTVKTRIHRGREMLRKNMTAGGGGQA